MAALRNQFGGHQFFTEAAAAEVARGDEDESGPLTVEPGATEHSGDGS